MIKNRIEDDLKEALKSKDAVAADALRMLKARIKNDEIAKQKEFDDDQVVEIIFSEVKKRNDSVEAFEKGGRMELAEKEKREITVLQKYLPQQLGEDEIRKIIEETISGQNFSAADFGKAMAAVMPKLKGKAQGSAISKVLKEILK